MGLRNKYNEELLILKENVIKMSQLTKQQYVSVFKALTEQNDALANDVIADDQIINELETSINVQSYLLIAKQGPVASDLRQLITSLKISNDYERIADYASNLAKYCLKIKDYQIEFVEMLSELGAIVMEMLDKIELAIINSDIQLAYEVSEMDSRVDDIYKKQVKKLIKLSKKTVDTESEEAIKTLLVLKQIERAGDHITNIAENIIYLVNGKRIELN